MRIGILTLPLSNNNYGGILQAWALQQVLREQGHKPILIDRHFNVQKPSFWELFKRCVSVLKNSVSIFLRGDKNIYLKNPFLREYIPWQYDQKFVSRKISQTKQLYNSAELYEHLSESGYDLVIVGSDQIWRDDYFPDITDFFLINYKGKKISYAASFGKDKDYISKDKMPQCRVALKQFSAVSCREYSGVEILKKDFGIEGKKVLDPTLLLQASDYIDLIGPKRLKPSEGVVSYILDSNSDKDAILSDIIRKIGSEVARMNLENDPQKGRPLEVEEWIANIANSEYVVTDSFHGCVFSIIFRKPFVAIANKERGLDRFLSLLKDCGLEDRLVFSFEDYIVKKAEVILNIDYDHVYNRLAKWRTDSLKFLKDAVS